MLLRSCHYFDLRLTDFLLGNISLEYKLFITFYFKHLSQSELDSAVSLYGVLQIREGDLTIADFMLSEISRVAC